jgi:hypothetical protein
MEAILSLIREVKALARIAQNVDDSWSSVELTGNYNTGIFSIFSSLQQIEQVLQIVNLLTVRIDSTLHSDWEEIQDYAGAVNSFTTWSLTVNKSFLSAKKIDNFYVNVFLSEQNCVNWLVTVDPTSEGNVFYVKNPIKIFVEGLDSPLGGPSLYFLPCEKSSLSVAYSTNKLMPTAGKVRENVHFVANSAYVDPASLLLCGGNYSSRLGKVLINKFSQGISVCIANEFFSSSSVVIDGIKRLTLERGELSVPTLVFYDKLVDLVQWLYEDRITTRKKLFNERLTLDISTGSSLLAALENNIDSAFKQARERYNFVILDRKDAYVKELKDLLKDLRSQSDLYAAKIRTLLSNFLRDTLAAIVLIGFTIFTKFTDNSFLNKNNMLDGVFYALGLYYLISMVMQAAVDYSDIRVTENELKYWKNVSKELIPDRDFEDHRKRSLAGRRTSARIIYPIICVLYVVIAVLCFNYPDYFRANLSK